MRVYLATIQSYCFLHSLKSFTKTNLVKKKRQKNPVSNAQTKHVAWETAPSVYCQQRNKVYVNTTNQTIYFKWPVSAVACTKLYFRMEIGTVEVKGLVQEHNRVTQ